MKLNARILAVVTASAAVLAASPAFAQGFGRGPGGQRGHGGMGPRIGQALDLDENQRSQIQTLRSEAREDLQAAREDIRETRDRLRQAWSAESPNRATILSLSEQLDTLHDVIRQRRGELRSEMRGVLTAEQQAQLDQMRGQRGQRGHHGRRGMHRGQQGEGEDGQIRRRGRRGGQGEGNGRRGQRFAQRLNLDEAQRSQAQALRQEMHQSTAQLREQMHQLRDQMRELRRSGQGDSQAMSALRTQAEPVETALREARVDFRLALHQILTPEQRAQLAEMGPRGPRGHRGHHGRGGRGGPRGGANFGQ